MKLNITESKSSFLLRMLLGLRGPSELFQQGRVPVWRGRGAVKPKVTIVCENLRVLSQ